MQTKIIDQNVHGKDACTAMIKLAPDPHYRPICHQCGSLAASVHSQDYRRYIRDLNMTSTQIWLDVEYRKIWCSNCSGAKVEQLSFADASKRVTHRLAQYIYGLCKVMTVHDIAEHLDLNPK